MENQNTNNNEFRDALKKMANEEWDDKKDPERSQRKNNITGCAGAGIIIFIIVIIVIYLLFKWIATWPPG